MSNTDDISKYSDGNSHYRSPTLARRTAIDEETFNEKLPKKDKKWSIGGFFRRKKKEADIESSSEEDVTVKRNFLQKRKAKKEEKRKKRPNKALGIFDHVVVAPALYGGNGINSTKSLSKSNEVEVVSLEHNSNVVENKNTSCNSLNNNEILSRDSHESLHKNRSDSNVSRGSLHNSLDSSGKKSRRGKVKARAEALRDYLKNESSSDEGSQKSTTSSITRFRSDESLVKNQNSSLNRKSRSARTERYIKRITKEDESIKKEKDLEISKINENDNIQIGISVKPQVNPGFNYSPSAFLHPKTLTGMSTIPPSHNMSHRTYTKLSNGQRGNYLNNNYHHNSNIEQHELNMQKNPKNHVYIDLKNNYISQQRSVSYDCNINRSPILQEGEVLHVSIPIAKPTPKPRNLSLVNQYYSNNSFQRITPPTPPPRDPHRKIYPNLQFDNFTRPMSYAFEDKNLERSSPTRPLIIEKSMRSGNDNISKNQNINRSRSFVLPANYRSNSDDYLTDIGYSINLQNRPASATPDMPQQKLTRRPFKIDQYQYFADKTPRSRKPIHITTPKIQADEGPHNSSQSALNRHSVKLNSQFWKQKDLEESRYRNQILETKSKEKFKTNELEVKNKNFSIISIPVKSDTVNSVNNSDFNPLYSKQVFEHNIEYVEPLSKLTEKNEEKYFKKDPPVPPTRTSSKHSSSSSVENNWNLEEETERKRRSSNLEEALDELEAIYKSLRLGDEDLLDRAERRDVPVAAQKLLNRGEHIPWDNSKNNTIHNYGFSVNNSPKKREIKHVPDKNKDDMAYRRLYKDKSTNSEPLPQASYLLASPLLGDITEGYSDITMNADEPDIILDDVVYRNLKHANNSLKVTEPQPPFGIPLGPITKASNSDYLHAVPEKHSRSRFVPQKSPDIVKDDLAYRNLRKDTLKDPTLPSFDADDYINNNDVKVSDMSLKKKKAVRSVSANIYNLMHKNAFNDENEFNKTQSLTDIADAMEIAHKVLKEHNSKIFSKMAISDTESVCPKTKFNLNFMPTSTETLTESKTNLISDPVLQNFPQQKLQVYVPLSPNEIILNQKPPPCPIPDKKCSRPSTKESTPNRVSPLLNDTTPDKSQLEEILTALAFEAKEASEKLDNDLKILHESNTKIGTPKISGRSTPNREESKASIKNINQKLMDIDAVSIHAKLCEKLLESVVESADLISTKTSVVGDIKETELMEEVTEMPTEPSVFTSVANIVVTRKADIPQSFDIRPELYGNSMAHDLDHNEDKIAENMHQENISSQESDISNLSGEEYQDSTIKAYPNKTSDCSPSQSDVAIETLENIEKMCNKEGEVCHDVECFAFNPEMLCFCKNHIDKLTLILNPPSEFKDDDSSNKYYENHETYISSLYIYPNPCINSNILVENVRTKLLDESEINFNTEINTNILDSNIPFKPVYKVVYLLLLNSCSNSVLCSNDCLKSSQTEYDLYDAKTLRANSTELFDKKNISEHRIKKSNYPQMSNEILNTNENKKQYTTRSVIFFNDSITLELTYSVFDLFQYNQSSIINEYRIFNPNISSAQKDAVLNSKQSSKVNNCLNCESGYNINSKLALDNFQSNDIFVDKYLHFHSNLNNCNNHCSANVQAVEQNCQNNFLNFNLEHNLHNSDACVKVNDLKCPVLHTEEIIQNNVSSEAKSVLKSVPLLNYTVKSFQEDRSNSFENKIRPILNLNNSICNNSDKVCVITSEKSLPIYKINVNQKEEDLLLQLPSNSNHLDQKEPVVTSHNCTDYNRFQEVLPSTSSHCTSKFSLSNIAKDDNLEYQNTESTSHKENTFDSKTPPERCNKEISKINDAVWYQDPATLALACSYGIACAHQLALLDVVTILGLFFAIISVIIALIL